MKIDYTFPNNPIKIGESAVDNDGIIVSAEQNDIWFHINKLPSPHIIISNSEEFPINLEMIKYCANLVKLNSKFKRVPNIKVIYTRVKNIRKTIGDAASAGKVTIVDKTNDILV